MGPDVEKTVKGSAINYMYLLYIAKLAGGLSPYIQYIFYCQRIALFNATAILLVIQQLYTVITICLAIIYLLPSVFYNN